MKSLEVKAERKPSYLVRMEGPVVEEVVATIDLDRMRAAGKLHLLKALKRDEKGGLRIEMHDAQAALKLLGQHHKLFTENVDLTSGGKPLPPIQVTIVNQQRAEANAS